MCPYKWNEIWMKREKGGKDQDLNDGRGMFLTDFMDEK